MHYIVNLLEKKRTHVSIIRHYLPFNYSYEESYLITCNLGSVNMRFQVLHM